jgi:hypothetical protein
MIVPLHVLVPLHDNIEYRFLEQPVLRLKKLSFDDSCPLLLGMMLSNDLFERIESL